MAGPTFARRRRVLRLTHGLPALQITPASCGLPWGSTDVGHGLFQAARPGRQDGANPPASCGLPSRAATIAAPASIYENRPHVNPEVVAVLGLNVPFIYPSVHTTVVPMVVRSRRWGCPFMPRALEAQWMLERTPSRGWSGPGPRTDIYAIAISNSFMRWNSHRTHRLATAATATFFGLPF